MMPARKNVQDKFVCSMASGFDQPGHFKITSKLQKRSFSGIRKPQIALKTQIGGFHACWSALFAVNWSPNGSWDLKKKFGVSSRVNDLHRKCLQMQLRLRVKTF